MAIKNLLRVLALVGLIGAFAGVQAAEEKVPLDKVPKAVKNAVKKRFAKGKLTEAAKETKNGKTEYEVTVTDKGRKIDVTLSPKGDILGLEKQIAAEDLPKVVSATLEKKYPKATYQLIEEVIKVKDGKEKLEYYELLLVTAEKKKLEVTVSPEGKLDKEEDKTKK